MNSPALLIINGSPRKNGTSACFGEAIKQAAQSTGHCAEMIHTIDFYNKKKTPDELMTLLSKSDILILTCPLYVDSLPYPTLCFFQDLYDTQRALLAGKRFFDIGQCGFPDHTLLQPIHDFCRCFSEATGMHWLGGLGYGTGPLINGTPLAELGRKGRRIRRAFNLALEDACTGKSLGPAGQKLLISRIPPFLYPLMALILNRAAWKKARQNGIGDLSRSFYLKN